MFKDSSDKTQQNSKVLYNYIRLHQPVSRAELQNLTDFKLTTLVRSINWLIQSKLIYTTETGESSGGRKPALYSINPKAGVIIGVDISRTYSRVVLMDLELNIIKAHSFGMFVENTPEATLMKISTLVKELCSGVEREKILGIGVGTVGPLNKETGTLMNPVNFPAKGWENVSIKSFLEKETGLFTLLENGANAAALGEFIKGTAKTYNSAVYVVAGVGLRLGTIFNGKIARNSTVNEEGFGHVIVDIFGEVCTCGSRGCLEAYTTIPAILGAFNDAIMKGRHSIAEERVDYYLSDINFDIFCEAVQKGDELAVEVISKASAFFAAGLTNLINIANPELIILGGPLVKKCGLFYKLSIEAAKENISRISSGKIKFTRGALGDDAVMIGCGNMVLDHFIL